eukprot:11213741-Lingulodinium_polyedra.AAC.1
MSHVNVVVGHILTTGLSIAGLMGAGASLGKGVCMRLGIAGLAIAEHMVSDMTVLIQSPCNSWARCLA